MPGIKSTLREFAENTSAHGVNKFVTAKGWFVKVIWVLVFLFASSMIIFQTSRLVRNYMRRPVTPTTNIVNKPLLFPTVTICNLNPAEYSLVKTERLFDVVTELANTINISLQDFPAYTSDAVYVELANTTVEQLLEDYMAEFRMQLNSEGRTKIEALSQPLQKFLVSCSFAGFPCYESDFDTLLNYDYGMCYQFPNTSRYENGIKINNAGSQFGLSLILDIDQMEYIPFLTPGAGVRVLIHEFQSNPFIFERGQSFPAGFETAIGIQPVITTKLPSPFGDCDPYSFYGDILACQRKCLEQVILSQCKCSRTATFEGLDIAEETGGDADNPCGRYDINCIKSVLKSKQEGLFVCDGCRHPCRTHSYEMKTSMTRFPSSHYDPALRYILNFWKEESAKIYSEEETRKNLVSIKVYFSELEEKNNAEEEAYPFESLLSDIGGQLGLWLGISILSVCECIELFYLIIRGTVNVKTKKSSVQAFTLNQHEP